MDILFLMFFEHASDLFLAFVHVNFSSLKVWGSAIRTEQRADYSEQAKPSSREMHRNTVSDASNDVMFEVQLQMQHLPLFFRWFLTDFFCPHLCFGSTQQSALGCVVGGVFFNSWGGSVSRGQSPTQGGVTHAVPLVQCSHLRIVVREDMAATAPLPPPVPSPVDLVPPPLASARGFGPSVDLLPRCFSCGSEIWAYY